MIGNQDIQANIESFIQNLLKAKVIEEKKIQELKNLNEKELDEGNYTSFEKDLCALIKGTLECGISFEIVTDPIALITQDKNGKQIASIVSKDTYNDLERSSQAHLDPFNKGKIVRTVSKDRVNTLEGFQEPVNNDAESVFLEKFNINPAPAVNKTTKSNMSNDFFKSHYGKIVVTTMAISSAIGFSIAGPIGATVLAVGGFVLGLCIASLADLVDRGLRSYRASKESKNSPTQNMPFLNRAVENNNQLNESTLGLTISN